MTEPIIVCYTCKHYTGNMRCKAFDKIPDDILIGKNDHRQAYPGDKGIRYEPIKK